MFGEEEEAGQHCRSDRQRWLNMRKTQGKHSAACAPALSEPSTARGTGAQRQGKSALIPTGLS